MGFINNLLTKSSIIFDEKMFESNINLSIQKMMIDRAIDLIAKTCAKSTIDVYRFNKQTKKVSKTKDDIYYTLNVRPNVNETGSSFWYSVFYKLLEEGEALVVSIGNDSLYLAETFDSSKDILKGKRFYNIIVKDSKNNSVELKKTFSNEDVFLFELGSLNKTTQFLNDFYKNYDQVIEASIVGFIKNNRSKWLVKTPTKVPFLKNKDGSDVSVESYAEKLTGKLLSNDDEIIQLVEGFEVENLSIKNQGNKDASFLNFIKEWGNLVASKFDIPLDVFWGNKTEKSQSTDDLITFACLYPMQVVEDAINAKSIDKKAYLNGDMVKFNKNTIKYRSALDISQSIDKLRAVGYSFNDINEMLDEPIVDEEWANKRYVTKNYMDVAEMGKEVNE